MSTSERATRESTTGRPASRPRPAEVGSPIHSARILHFGHDDADPRRSRVPADSGRVPPAEFLAERST
ncbi:hypothetical protein ACFV4N_29795 [Actinosynnema sp. NPDC059797]